MANRQVITCDECGAERRDVNHWFAVHEHDGVMFGVVPMKAQDADPELYRTDIYSKHICGESCLHKRLARFCAALNPNPQTPAQETTHANGNKTTG